MLHGDKSYLSVSSHPSSFFSHASPDASQDSLDPDTQNTPARRGQRHQPASELPRVLSLISILSLLAPCADVYEPGLPSALALGTLFPPAPQLPELPRRYATLARRHARRLRHPHG